MRICHRRLFGNSPADIRYSSFTTARPDRLVWEQLLSISSDKYYSSYLIQPRFFALEKAFRRLRFIGVEPLGDRYPRQFTIKALHVVEDLFCVIVLLGGRVVPATTSRLQEFSTNGSPEFQHHNDVRTSPGRIQHQHPLLAPYTVAANPINPSEARTTAIRQRNSKNIHPLRPDNRHSILRPHSPG